MKNENLNEQTSLLTDTALIREGNILIAKFYGQFRDINNSIIRFYEGLFYNTDTIYTIDLLNFHKSWDRLIPACKKFCKLEKRSENNLKYVNLNSIFEEYKRDISFSILEFESSITFEKLVNGIKWYNAENNK